jgi:thiamine monophosphate synthase
MADNDTEQTIPIGRQRMTGVRALVAAYRQMESPVLISERVWIERRADNLAVHLGQPAAEEAADTSRFAEAIPLAGLRW